MPARLRQSSAPSVTLLPFLSLVFIQLHARRDLLSRGWPWLQPAQSLPSPPYQLHKTVQSDHVVVRWQPLRGHRYINVSFGSGAQQKWIQPLPLSLWVLLFPSTPCHLLTPHLMLQEEPLLSWIVKFAIHSHFSVLIFFFLKLPPNNGHSEELKNIFSFWLCKDNSRAWVLGFAWLSSKSHFPTTPPYTSPFPGTFYLQSSVAGAFCWRTLRERCKSQ